MLTWMGCSRAAYRERADRQVYQILSEKSTDPRWSLPRIDVTPSPESRFYDANNPDCPPLPPGDPAAFEYMLCVDGMHGSRKWRRLPREDELANPYWMSSLVLSPSADGMPGIQSLTLAHAVRLSLINSREYQNEIENLYLAALALTFEQYLFQVRPIGFLGDPGTFLFYQHQPDDRSDLVASPTNFGLSKLFPSGAQLIAEMVNDTIWMFSGPNDSTTSTIFAFALIQPLLRGGGRDVVLEDLTQSERNVLYAVRDFARFRKEFFVSTITGGQVAGLQRFLRGFEFLASGSDAPSVGFFPLLLRLQQLRNRQYIVRTIEYLIDDLEAADADPLDITQLENNLADNRGDLIADTRNFEDRVDQYKVQLGLPPDIPVTLDDSMLAPFEFVDPRVLDLEDRLRAFARKIRSARLPAGQQELLELLDGLGQLAADTTTSIDLVATDQIRLDELLPALRAELSPADRDQLDEIVSEERQRMTRVTQDLDKVSEKLLALRTESSESIPDARQRPFVDQIEQLREELLLVVRQLSVIQIIVRVELIPLQPARLEMDQAVTLAVENRLDLMNRRALVTDARRNLEVAANALEGDLDIVAEGEVRTKPLLDSDEAFDFRAKDSEYRLGIAVTTPLDRRQARNRYRASQIAYQRARRDFMGTEDQVKLQVRQDVRTLDELSQTIIQRRRRVQFSARELVLAESQAQESQRGLSLNNALRNLNRAQDELIEIWLDYETTRLNLYRDIGTMEIDEQGFWVDRFYQQMVDVPWPNEDNDLPLRPAQ